MASSDKILMGRVVLPRLRVIRPAGYTIIGWEAMGWDGMG